MGGKKKSVTAKTRTLAGEPLYSSALAPSEERIFKETTARFRQTAIRMREESDRFSGAGPIVRVGEQAAKVSVSFFCKHFEGKYQRTDIVEALATAATLPEIQAFFVSEEGQREYAE